MFSQALILVVLASVESFNRSGRRIGIYLVSITVQTVKLLGTP